MQSLTLFLAISLAFVHLIAGKLRFLDRVPRSRWLSFASGLSVAYVFVHLLPEMAANQGALREAKPGGVVDAEAHVWLVALAGLVVFYGLERMAKCSRAKNANEAGRDRTESQVFWLHIASYGLYNVLVGYLLLDRESDELAPLLFFWFAMALHFFVNDYGLRRHHREQYGRVGRWVLGAAVLAGWGLGSSTELSAVSIATLTAFLGGGVVLNVLKEELPEERESRFAPFALGAALYSALLLSI